MVSLVLTLLMRLWEENGHFQARLSSAARHFFPYHCNNELVASTVTSFSFLVPVMLTTRINILLKL